MGCYANDSGEYFLEELKFPGTKFSAGVSRFGLNNRRSLVVNRGLIVPMEPLSRDRNLSDFALVGSIAGIPPSK